MMERLMNIFKETASHPRFNPGVEPRASDLSVLYHLSYDHLATASLHNSQYHYMPTAGG